LPRNHAFRRNRAALRKDRNVTTGSSRRLFGKELYAKVKDYPMITTNDDFVILGYKKNEYNWTKKSIFWELPYWEH